MQKISLEQIKTLVKESYDYDMGKLSKDSETYRVLKDYPHLGILDLYRMCLTFNYWYVNINNIDKRRNELEAKITELKKGDTQ